MIGKFEEDGTIETMVQEEIETARRNGRTLTYEEAMDEVTANACEFMLKDTQSIARLANESPDIFKKVKNVIGQIITNIKKAFSGLRPGSLEHKRMREILNDWTDIQKLWDDAYVDSSKRAKEAQGKAEAINEKAGKDSVYSPRNFKSIKFKDDEITYIDNKLFSRKKTADYKKYIEVRNEVKTMLANLAKEIKFITIKDNGEKLYLDRAFANEYANSDNSLSNNFNMRNVKMNAASQIKNIIENAKYYDSSEGKKSKKLDDKNGYDYYKIMFAVKKSDGTYTYYTGQLVARKDSFNRSIAHDVVNIYSSGRTRHNTSDPHQNINSGAKLPLDKGKISQKDINVNTNSNISHSFRRLDTKGRTLSPEQVNYFADSKIRDKDGALKVMYHGTARADRVGNVFRTDRATSGPFAYFTDSEEIGNNYAKDKSDTSLAYDELYSDYYSQFRIDVNGLDMSISEAWNRLPQEKRAEIKEKASHITWDEDGENIVYNEDVDYGVGDFDYNVKDCKGNILKALTQEWLEYGELYNRESDFIKVLELAGLDNVRYMDPEARNERTYEAYLNVTNPFDAGNISEDMADKFRRASEHVDFNIMESNGADLWDKKSINPEKWIKLMDDDIKKGTSHAWTVIPDWVTDVLKENGYDGIIDKGGKQGGDIHTVVIPFSSNQVKNVDNLNPTENEDISYSHRNIYDKDNIYVYSDRAGRVEKGMKDEERAKVLSDTHITVAKCKVNLTDNEKNNLKKTVPFKLEFFYKMLGDKFGIYKKYKGGNIEWKYSKRSVTESANKEEQTHDNSYRIVQMMSAFNVSDKTIPVEIIAKERKENNTIRMVVTLNEIEADVIGTRSGTNAEQNAPRTASINVSVSELLQSVNEKDGSFLKCFPAVMLSNAQIISAREAQMVQFAKLELLSNDIRPDNKTISEYLEDHREELLKKAYERFPKRDSEIDGIDYSYRDHHSNREILADALMSATRPPSKEGPNVARYAPTGVNVAENKNAEYLA